jgi:hypothetical protein
VPAPLGLLPEPLHHLPPVRRLEPLPALPAGVDRDDRGPRPEVLPRAPVVFLGVERGVSARTRSQVTARDAWAMTGRNCGKSFDGPVATVAPARKWVFVSHTTVSLVHSRDECGRPARRSTARCAGSPARSRPPPRSACPRSGRGRSRARRRGTGGRRRPLF